MFKTLKITNMRRFCNLFLETTQPVFNLFHYKTSLPLQTSVRIDLTS